ncbi:MAG: hypothetical protein U0704_08120 [Candidatus Eisenbacteria bacterium]
MEGPLLATPNAIAPETPLNAHPDRRIADLARLVESGNYAVLSLDVFDTIVWRAAPRPTDVFFHVAEELRRQGALHESSSAESFVRERVNAEMRARRHAPGGEATLEQIWAEFPRGYLRRATLETGMHVELECERRVVRVYEPMRALIAHARAHRLKIAFVSDTYFSRRQVRDLVGIEPDWLVVSCEHGASKHAGLHRVLLQKSNVAPERILHAGDNHAADVEGPGRFGITRYWFRRFPDEFAPAFPHELPDSLTARAAFVTQPDHGLTALRSQTMAECTDAHERWGAGVLGPVLTGYVRWLASRCAAEGIATVFCLMREGRTIRAALEAIGAPVAAHEVFVSRYVALKASIVRGCEDEILRFVRRPSAVRVKKLFAQLGLEPADMPDLDPESSLPPAATKAFARRVANDPHLRRKVVECSAAARQALLAHLRPMLPPRGGTVAFADLGYKGTIQMGLQEVFDHAHLGVRTHGLYLVTGGEVHETQGTGATVEGWLAENGQPTSMAHTFMRSPEIFEQGLMADCGTTLGHEADGTPKLDEFHVPPEQRAEIAAVQRGALRFARRWVEHEAREGAPDDDVLRDHCRAITVRAIARPRAELELFGHWQHDENFGSERVRSLTTVADLHDWERTHLSAHQLASLPHRQVYWPFGLAWATSPTLGDAVAHIFLRSAAPQAFDSAAGPQPMTFLWDDGGGFREECCQAVEYTLNSRGSCWHRASLGVQDRSIAQVGFGLAAPRALLRVTGMRVHWRAPDGTVESGTFAPESLLVHGAEPLAPGLWRVGDQAALVIATLPERAGFRGVLDTDVFFALMPEAA